MQPLSDVLENVYSEGFRDTKYSSKTPMVLNDPDDSNALKEYISERAPLDGCLNNFSCRFTFYSDF